ncbi:hypothetical protein BBJ29_008631 [Phytophthora kernoviae]|uniref:Uncharacterized protein n=1 Tax=Phytophthora kernoviae TaxID=325452 RepID=A0A3F2RH30_9STRA|nr:hypothetical protein BBJ29_008631 [Phytophthora kernoviae]RLN55690.1 hypothetical protein BBP00_00008381 [Phytophthora kernoviae]
MNDQYMFDPVGGYSRESTSQLEKQGVCEDLDAKTLALSPFGTQLQFKDTPACHKHLWRNATTASMPLDVRRGGRQVRLFAFLPYLPGRSLREH